MPPDESDARNLPAARPSMSAAATAARAHLECVAGPDKGQTFRVAPSVTLLGRDESCDVALTETSISRQHARIDRSGEGWTIKNLSTNGTGVNKKPVDEAALSDGDTIHLGAKTRLRFVIETVAVSPTGRPQFRARISASAEPEEETPEQKEEGAPEESLFRRRKKLFISLGAYLGALLILMAILLGSRDSGFGGKVGVPQLTPVDMVMVPSDLVVTAPNGLRTEVKAQMLRIVNETREGIVAEGGAGASVFIPADQLKSGKAVIIRGIRSSLTRSPFPPSHTINKGASDQAIAQGMDLYTKRGQSPSNLFNSVRRFQAALAALRSPGYLPDTKADQVYRTALNELVNKVQKEYDRAILEEKIGHDKAAIEIHNRIIKMVPDSQSPVFKNVVARMGEIYRRNPKLK